MLFMQEDECSRGPMSRCKVPWPGIILGGFGLKGSRFCGLRVILSLLQCTSVPQKSQHPVLGFTVSRVFICYVFLFLRAHISPRWLLFMVMPLCVVLEKLLILERSVNSSQNKI